MTHAFVDSIEINHELRRCFRLHRGIGHNLILGRSLLGCLDSILRLRGRATPGGSLTACLLDLFASPLDSPLAHGSLIVLGTEPDVIDIDLVLPTSALEGDHLAVGRPDGR